MRAILLGFGGRIITFVRIDPMRFGIAGRLWLAAARWSSTELVAVSRFIRRLLHPAFPSRLVYEHVTPDRVVDGPPASRRPILLFVGDRDVRTPSWHAKNFYKAVKDTVPAQFELIDDMPHQLPWYYRHQVKVLGLISDYLEKDCGPNGI